MTRRPEVFVPRDAVGKIAGSSASGGDLVLGFVPAEDFFVVTTVETGSGTRSPVDIPNLSVLSWTGSNHAGQWVRRGTDGINLSHRELLSRPTHHLPFDSFKRDVPQVRDPGETSGFLITHDPDLPDELRKYGLQEFAAWEIRRDGVRPLQIDIEPAVIGIKQLEGLWPLDALEEMSVMVVGAGSIGGYTAEALARFGVGTIQLVDPDRLRWHNGLRHLLGIDDVGAHKVNAVARHLQARWPETRAVPRILDVVEEAHLLRPLLAEVDLVICTADGIAPRRVISHLARRAKKTAVLACVLDNGAFGEVLRLRPTPRFGCLLCLRQYQADQGSIDIEAAQELDYGTGHVHLPMTAVPPDLQLIGVLAAKVGVATLMEPRLGDHTQRVPDEYAMVGLRPAGEGLLPPFDVERVGEIKWQGIPEPRADCPTCNP